MVGTLQQLAVPSPGAPESEILEDVRNDLSQMEAWLTGIERTAVADEAAASATAMATAVDAEASVTSDMGNGALPTPSDADTGLLPSPTDTGLLPSPTDITGDSMIGDVGNSTDADTGADGVDGGPEPTARPAERAEKRDIMIGQGERQGSGRFLSAEQLEAEMVELMG